MKYMQIVFNQSDRSHPEKFYHSFSRYDIMLEPLHEEDDAIIIEFKVFYPQKEQDLSDTLALTHAQSLIAKGIPKEKIRKYGFVFEEKTVLIG